MTAKIYSERLGPISDEQFQAALDHFNLGRFVRAEPIPFGLFGQNVFVSSTEGEFVLRGDPSFWWQFPTEQFYTRLLHERTQVPVPWPYLIDFSTEIFGWSYALMPRMPGLLRPGFAERFPVYMLLERSIIWEYFQRVGQPMWPEDCSFRDWAGQFLSL